MFTLGAQLMDPNADTFQSHATISPIRFVLVLTILIAAVWPEVLLGTHTFIARDYGHFGYPLAHFHRVSFWLGEVPLWNPLSNCGLPFLAQWNTMTLYPGSLIYLLLPLPWSLGIFCLVHLLWGGLGMFLLARRWTNSPVGSAIAGTAFAFNGVLLNSLMWPNNIAALGWMPWVVLATERGWRQGYRALSAAGIVGAMQMLTGGPEVILLTWILCLVFAVAGKSGPVPMFRLRGLRFSGIVTLVGLLSSAQLLPFLDLLHQSQRNEHFFEGAWAMPGTGWANLLVPLFGCLKTSQGRFYQWDQYWTSSYYAGTCILALALVAAWKIRKREVWILSVVTVLALLMALGDRGGVLPSLKWLLPQIGYLRYPIKLVVCVSFCLPLLAAFGLRGVLPQRLETTRFHSLFPAAPLAAILTLVIAGIILFGTTYPQPRERWEDTLQNGLLRAVALWVCLASCAIASNSRSRILKLLPSFVVAADLLTAVPLLSPTVSSVVLRPDLPQPAPRPVFGLSRAMITFAAHQQFNTFGASSIADDFLVKRAALFGNANLIDGIPKLDGFYSLYLNRADKVLSALYFQTNHSDVAQILSSTNSISFDGLCTFLGVSQTSGNQKHYEWSIRTNFMPLFSTGQTCVATNETATLTALLRPDFNPRHTVFLPEGTTGIIDSGNHPQAEVIGSHYRANTLEVVLDAPAKGLLVVAQAFHPNWRAALDGQPVNILPANIAFQAVPIQAGRQFVKLRYEDPGFIWGVVISSLAILVTALPLRHRVMSSSHSVSPISRPPPHSAISGTNSRP